jgi:OmpA-OmpF porin, OOP family
MSRRFVHSLSVTLVLAVALAPAAHAQGFLKKLKDKASEKVNERIDERTDEALDSLINGSETVIKCIVTDQSCIDKVHAAGKQVQYVDKDGNPVADQPDLNGQASGGASGAAPVDSTPPGVGVWLNYDFVPGDKVLFYDDFANDHVGDLPTHEDVTDGNMTIVNLNGTKYLRSVSGGTFWINLPDSLPQRFTIEAVWHGPNANPLNITIGADGDHQVQVWCYPAAAGVSGSGMNGDKDSRQDATGIDPNGFSHCRFMFDSGYVKVYIENQRLGQLNGLLVSHTKKIKVEVPVVDAADGGALLTDLRVAEGGKPLYQALVDSGHVSTHGILFASGSSTIQGESTPTLQEIGDMLTQHADLKLLIEGHTDNVGDSTSNQTLSEQRAAAVKQYLVAHFKIDGSRLTTKGYGDTKPIDTNATAEGRQNNRRVELVKQ